MLFLPDVKALAACSMEGAAWTGVGKRERERKIELVVVQYGWEGWMDENGREKVGRKCTPLHHRNERRLKH